MRAVLSGFPTRRASWVTIAFWLAIAVVFAPFGTKVTGITNDAYVLPGGSQTAQLHKFLAERFPGGDQQPSLIVYRHAGGLTAQDKQKIAADARAVTGLPHLGRPIPPFSPAAPPGVVSPKGDVAVTIVPFLQGKIFHVTPTMDAIRSRVASTGPLEVHVTGWPAFVSDYNSAVKQADVKLFAATAALVLFLLLLVYRSPILALVPLLVVGISYAIVNGIVYVLNRVIGLPVDSTSTSLLLVLMFGAGTDYALLLVSRYGAELRRTDSSATALRTAIPRAMAPILASGVTVIAALLTTLAGVFGVYRTFGPVSAIGIAVVMIASLTLLPAILALLGRHAYWPNERSVTPGGPVEARRSRWQQIGLRVRGRPWLYLGASLAVLAIGVSGLAFAKTHVDPISQFRSPNDSVRGFRVLQSAFPPGSVSPTSILVAVPKGRVLPHDLTTVSSRVRAVDGVRAVLDTGRRSVDGRAALLNVVYDDPPFDGPALTRTKEVRTVAAAALPNAQVLVGDGSGERLDARTAENRDLKVIVPLVLLVVLVTLIVLLRSLVAPLYLLGTVILSFAATFGFTVMLFHFVFGQDAFNAALPVVIFVFLVALGSDYNIFLMSRVREESARIGTRDGMLNALAATGPVITSAGLILAGTFAVLTIIPSWDLSFVGIAIALGVLLDTFVVRSICVPALTWIVGDRSWWPSTAKEGRSATVVTGVYTVEELLGVEPGQSAEPGVSDAT